MTSRVLRGRKEGDFKGSQREERRGLQGFSEGGRRGTSKVLRELKEAEL